MRWLTNNLGIKVGSLIIASMLSAYVYVYLNYPTTQTFFLPIKVRNLRDDLIITSKQPDVERVFTKVRGPYRSIRQIINGGHSAGLDCSEIKESGQLSLRLKLPDFGQVVVVDQDPVALNISVERKVTRSIKVEIQHRGEPAEGQVITSESTSVPEVTISGPESSVKRVASASIQPTIKDAAHDASSLEQVQLFDAESLPLTGSKIKIDPPAVHYRLELTPRSDTRLLAVIPAYVGLPPEHCILMSLAAKPAYVALKENLVPPRITSVRTAPVDLSKATESFSATVAISYPFELPADTEAPRECKVYAEISSMDEAGVGAKRLPIKLANRSERYEYFVSPPQVIVRLDGAGDLSREEQDRLAALIDVGGMAVGEYQLTPQLNLPLGIERITIIPDTLKLSIIERRK